MSSENDRFITAAKEHFGDDSFTRSQFLEFGENSGFGANVAQRILIYKRVNRIKHGLYTFSELPNVDSLPKEKSVNVLEAVAVIESSKASFSYVPKIDDSYVSWGHFNDLKTIVDSRRFFPTYICGPSGNGKTMMVEQICAKSNREFIRVQITPETDEDDLIGGWRLVKGETVFSKGPVITAMEMGAILLIDEVDRGSNKLMCLQGILEGKPVLIKKTGEIVAPKSGFNIICTANTKGNGDPSGKFISASIIDDAFLERFTISLEQSFPSKAIERKILLSHLEKFGVDVETDVRKEIELLVTWSDSIRKTYKAGGVDDVVSTRRLCHIVETYSVFKNFDKSVNFCLARFEEDTNIAFSEMYKALKTPV